MNRAWRIHKRLEQKRERLLEAQSLTQNITVNYEPREGGGSGNLQSLQDMILRVMELEREVAELERDFETACVETRTVIARVPNPVYRTVLERRYLRFQSWEEIGAVLVLDRDVLKNTHKRAVKNVTEVLIR